MAQSSPTALPPLCGFDWSRPVVMGILNVTPDSFSDGGQFTGVEAALAHAARMVDEGADIIDVGGESTRPGAEMVPEAEELARVTPVIEAIKSKLGVPVSIDTRKSGVMRAAVVAGADMINDVSALSFDPASLRAAVELQVPVVLMHAQGDPRTMQDAPRYKHVVAEVFGYLQIRAAQCREAGILPGRIIVDPGIGFGKTLEHNLTLLAHLSTFHTLNCPVMLGASRKSFIAKLDGDAPASSRLGGSLAAICAGVAQGVQIFRVHDVKETVQAIKVSAAIGKAAR